MSDLHHYRFVDALRGVAFLAVLSVHAGQMVPGLPGASLTAAGQYGVQLFFLLSAVTLMRSMAVRSTKERFPLRNFFLRRFFRIAPLFWMGIAFYLAVDRFRPRPMAPYGVDGWDVVSTVFFVHGWSLSAFNSVVPGGWSIAVEMTFYACLPLLAKWLRSARAAFIAAGVALLSWVVVRHFWMPTLYEVAPVKEHLLIPLFCYVSFPSQLPIFLLGMGLYYCLQKTELRAALKEGRRAEWLAAGALAGLIVLTQFSDAVLSVAHVPYAILWGLLIVALAVRSFNWIVNPLTCWLGTLSFSCYLNHFGALRLLERVVLAEHFASLPPAVGKVAHFGVVWVGGLLLTTAVSWVTYTLIEKTGIRLGKWVIQRSEERPAGEMA